MKSYRIHFIRHGACEESRRGVYVGTKDVPLSEEGIRELKELDEAFDYPGTPVVFTSPLKRCTQTCNILYPAIPPIVINELCECSFGEWEGRTADSLSANEDFKKWLAGDTSVKPPKGESGAEFTRRVCNIFQKIVDGLISTGNTNAVIVTHGGVIMTLLSVYGLPQAKPFDWVCDDGCGYSMRITPSLWMRDRVGEVYAKLPYPKRVDEYEDDSFKREFFGDDTVLFDDV